MARIRRTVNGGDPPVPPTIPASDIATLKTVDVMNFNGQYNVTISRDYVTFAGSAAGSESIVAIPNNEVLKYSVMRACGTVYICGWLTQQVRVNKRDHFMVVSYYNEKEKSTAVNVMPEAWLKEYFGGLVGNLTDNLKYEIALVMMHAVSSCPTVYTGLHGFEVPPNPDVTLEDVLDMEELNNVKGEVKIFGKEPRFFDVATMWDKDEFRAVNGQMFFRESEVFVINVNTAAFVINYGAMNAVVKEKDVPYTIGFALLNGDVAIFEFSRDMRKVTFDKLIEFLGPKVDYMYEVNKISNYVYDARHQQYVSINQPMDTSVLDVTSDHAVTIDEFTEDVTEEEIAAAAAAAADQAKPVDTGAHDENIQGLVEDMINAVGERTGENASMRLSNGEGANRDDIQHVDNQSPGGTVLNGQQAPLTRSTAGSEGRQTGEHSGAGVDSSLDSTIPSPTRASTPIQSTSAVAPRQRPPNVLDWSICQPAQPLPVVPVAANGRYRQERHFVDVRVNPELHEELKGKNCFALQKLRDEFEVELDFAQSTDADRWVIRIYGPSFVDVRDCKERILLIATNLAKSRTVNRRAREAAEEKAKVKVDAPKLTKITVPIPFAYQEFLIGLQGAQDPLRLKFNDKYDVSISGPSRTAPNQDEVTLIGTEANVGRAKTAVDNERKIYNKMPKRTFDLATHTIDKILGKTKETFLKTTKTNKLKHIQIGKNKITVTVYGSTKSVVEKAEDKFLSHQLRINEAIENEAKKKERAVLRAQNKAQRDAAKAAKDAKALEARRRKRSAPRDEPADPDVIDDSIFEEAHLGGERNGGDETERLTAYTVIQSEHVANTTQFLFDGHESDEPEERVTEPTAPAVVTDNGPPAKKQPRQDVYLRRAAAAKIKAAIHELSDEEIDFDFGNALYEDAMQKAVYLQDRVNLLKRSVKHARDVELKKATRPKPVVATVAVGLPMLKQPSGLAPVSLVGPSQGALIFLNKTWLWTPLMLKWVNRGFPIVATTWPNVHWQMQLSAYKVAAAHVHTQWTSDYWELQSKVGKFYMSQREKMMETPEQRAVKYKKQSACRRLRFARLRAHKLGQPIPTAAEVQRQYEEKMALRGEPHDSVPPSEFDELANVVPHAQGEHDYTMYESEGEDDLPTADDHQVAEGDDQEPAEGVNQELVEGDDEEVANGDNEESGEGDDEETVEGDAEEAVEGDDDETVEGDDEESVEGDAEETVEGDDDETVEGDDDETIEGDDGEEEMSEAEGTEESDGGENSESKDDADVTAERHEEVERVEKTHSFMFEESDEEGEGNNTDAYDAFFGFA